MVHFNLANTYVFKTTYNWMLFKIFEKQTITSTGFGRADTAKSDLTAESKKWSLLFNSQIQPKLLQRHGLRRFENSPSHNDHRQGRHIHHLPSTHKLHQCLRADENNTRSQVNIRGQFSARWQESQSGLALWSRTPRRALLCRSLAVQGCRVCVSGRLSGQLVQGHDADEEVS